MDRVGGGGIGKDCLLPSSRFYEVTFTFALATFTFILNQNLWAYPSSIFFGTFTFFLFDIICVPMCHLLHGGLKLGNCVNM